MDVFNQLKQTAKDIMPKATIENNRKILRNELTQNIQTNQNLNGSKQNGQVQTPRQNNLNGNATGNQAVAKEPEQPKPTEDDDSDLEITEVR